jgi:hypothetical protein
MKKIVASNFIVFDEITDKEVSEFDNLDDALEESYNNDNYQVIVLDKHGNNVSVDYWKENY